MKRHITSTTKPITAAEKDSKLDEAISQIDADFEYILSGLEKLGRSGAGAENDALIIAEALSKQLGATIAQIADKISE